MNKTLIEWCLNPDGSPGYTWNVITGCLGPKGDGVHCPYCYAKRLANGRLKERYLANSLVAYDYGGGKDGSDSELKTAYTDPFYPRFWEERLEDIKPSDAWWDTLGGRKQKGIFVCDMGELFGNWVPKEWQDNVFAFIKSDPFDRFYLLTKQPQNLIKFSPFPENCFVGVTATEQCQFVRAVSELRFIEATIKYLSFEPLLAHIPMLPEALTLAGINWLIIGAMTGSLEDIKKMLMEYPQLTLRPYGKKWTLQPKLEWVEEIVKVADKAGMPVFLKNNLKPMFGVMTSTEAIKYGNLNKSHLIEEIAFNEDNKIIAHNLRQEIPDDKD
jgi:protein gp37